MPWDKNDLRDMALQLALDRALVISSVRSHLHAAVELLRNWSNAHHSFVDGEAFDLSKKIEQLNWAIPSEMKPLFTALTGREPDVFDYVNGNEMSRLRCREAEARGIDLGINEDDRHEKLPDETPLDLFLRLKNPAICQGCAKAARSTEGHVCAVHGLPLQQQVRGPRNIHHGVLSKVEAHDSHGACLTMQVGSLEFAADPKRTSNYDQFKDSIDRAIVVTYEWQKGGADWIEGTLLVIDWWDPIAINGVK